MQSFWHTTAPDTAVSDPAAARDVDVAIIGAGYSGLSLAWRLASAGTDVSVFEADRVAGGASGRNGGMVAPGTSDGYASTVKMFGQETAKQLFDLSWRCVALIDELARTSPIDIELHMPGRLQLARDEEELVDVMSTKEAMERDGFETRSMQHKDLPEALQSLYVGGYWRPGGIVHSGRFTAALAERALRAGARIFAPAPVKAVERTAGGFRIQLPGISLQAKRIVYATNGFTRLLLSPQQAAIIPQRGQVLATEPLPPILPYAVGAHNGYEYYHQRRDGRLIIGGWRDLDFQTEETHEVALNDRIQAALTAFARQISRPDVRIEASWSGTMGFTPDHLPIVGQLEDNVYISAGFSGHGVVFAPIIGELLGGVMLGAAAPELGVFGPSRDSLKQTWVAGNR